MIGHHRDRGIGESDFPCEYRLGHPGHADQIRTIALQSIDLGRRFKPRPLGRCIHPAVDHCHAGFLRRSETTLTQHRLVRPGEINVLHTTVFDAVKRTGAAMGVINNLVWCSDDTGLHISTDAADCGDPDHRLDALRV